ncbi:MAG TPA: hypothetical protein VMR97_05555, partial [Acidimicrobiales bacterium]|nr:hypothetical protein [Acidimicrobiales bacterium]
MRVGGIDIVPVSDGSGAVPPSLLLTASEKDWEPHRKFLDAGGLLPMELGGFLLRGPEDHVALVDLGLGPLGAKIGMAHFLDSL